MTEEEEIMYRAVHRYIVSPLLVAMGQEFPHVLDRMEKMLDGTLRQAKNDDTRIEIGMALRILQSSRGRDLVRPKDR